MTSQSAYATGRAAQSGDVEADIHRAMYLYCREDLGLPQEDSLSHAKSQMERAGAKQLLSDLAAKGVTVAGRRVLDLGAGLGALSEELVLQGAETFAVEPGAAWGSLARRRVVRHGSFYDLREARGEELPFGDCSMDVVVSLQVLEHVQDPAKVLAEAWRVLKPGGYFYLACENYLAFKEGHYRVFWLPLFPKSLASGYLKLRGRPSRFLRESVTYVTFPQVMRWTRRLGFERCKEATIEARLSEAGLPVLMYRPAKKAERAAQTFRFGIWELFRKPS